MQDELMELDIIKDKMNNKMEAIKADDALKNAFNLLKGIDELEQYQKVTVDPFVKTKKKGLLGKATVFFKRLCRKIVAWYLQPVCDEQTRYNHQVYMMMTAMKEILTVQFDEYEKRRKEQEELWNYIKRIDEEIEFVKDDIEKS